MRMKKNHFADGLLTTWRSCVHASKKCVKRNKRDGHYCCLRRKRRGITTSVTDTDTTYLVTVTPDDVICRCAAERKSKFD